MRPDEEFQARGKKQLEVFFKIELSEKLILPTKRWDYVSADESIVGDAKLLSYEGSASAEKSIISEHVWLLEKIPARVKFILFGGNSNTPVDWLRRWRQLLPENILFLYLEGDKVTPLFTPKMEHVWQSFVDSGGRWKV
jgi:hypothetical protein